MIRIKVVIAFHCAISLNYLLRNLFLQTNLNHKDMRMKKPKLLITLLALFLSTAANAHSGHGEVSHLTYGLIVAASLLALAMSLHYLFKAHKVSKIVHQQELK